MIDLFCPSKKVRLKANSELLIDSETILAIGRGIDFSKNPKISVWRLTKVIFDRQK